MTGDGRVNPRYRELADRLSRVPAGEWISVVLLASDPVSVRDSRSAATAVAAAGRRYGWETRRETSDGVMTVRVRAVTNKGDK